MVLDLSVGRQTYIEDCEVCCKPIEISFTVEDDELADFDANPHCRAAVPMAARSSPMPWRAGRSRCWRRRARIGRSACRPAR